MSEKKEESKKQDPLCYTIDRVKIRRALWWAQEHINEAVKRLEEKLDKEGLNNDSSD